MNIAATSLNLYSSCGCQILSFDGFLDPGQCTLKEIHHTYTLFFILKEAFGFKKTHESCVRDTERSRTPVACALQAIKSRKFSCFYMLLASLHR